MAIKILGSPFSHAVQKALLALEEKELEYEFVFIDMQNGEHKESFLSRNPFGQVPALEDEDLKLFGKFPCDHYTHLRIFVVGSESRAITHWLSNNYAELGIQLLSSNPKKQTIIGIWLEVESHKFDDAAIKVSPELLVKPIYNQKIDEVALVEYEVKLSTVLDVYEARLSESKYLGGDSFSLADLHHIPSINAMFTSKAKKLVLMSAHGRRTYWHDQLGARCWDT